MPIDKIKLYISSSSILAILLLLLFTPGGSGRILAALLLLPAAIVIHLVVKKRVILSIYKNQVAMLMGAIGALYLMFYFVTGLHFGFLKTGYGFQLDVILRLTIPIAVIIVTTEVIRHILVAQKDRLASVICFFICLTADILIVSTISGINTFSTFMDVIGLTLFPGILFNLLYNYLSVRYGILPCLIYRAITVWSLYLIPYASGIPDSLVGMIQLLLPIAIYFFIDSLYEKRRRYALGEKSFAHKTVSHVLTALAVIIMVGTVMLVSNQFKYGALVIATDSMTGSINKGDVVIMEKYDTQAIEKGQVIVFASGKAMFVHRVVDIEIINGSPRYYTQGDANEDRDSGFRTKNDIVGLVDHKIPSIGYPTLWLRSLFNQQGG